MLEIYVFLNIGEGVNGLDEPAIYAFYLHLIRTFLALVGGDIHIKKKPADTYQLNLVDFFQTFLCP